MAGMSNDAHLPVVVGLAVGIAFILLISLHFSSGGLSFSATQQHDDWLSQTAYNLPEVKAFRDKYGQIGATGHSLSGLDGMRICYTFPPMPCESQFDDNLKAYLEVTLDVNGKPLAFILYCYSERGSDHLLGSKIEVKHFLETSEYCQR